MKTLVHIETEDNEYNDFIAGFVRAVKVPKDSKGKPVMSDAEWIQSWTEQRVFKEYDHGRRLSAADKVIVNKNILK